jgi:hypothetical protein
VNTNVLIRGFGFGGPTISGSGSTEVFVVPSGVSVNLTGLQIANGSAAHGGAIDNAGNLTIRSCTFLNNRAIGDPSSAGAGGAIFNDAGARLTLLQTRLIGNQAIDNVPSGGIATGGAIADGAGSSVTIRNSVFTANQAISIQGPSDRGIGGAIANTSATLLIAGSRFNMNSARGPSLGQSGAIDNRNGIVTISNSSFTSNRAIGTGTGGFAASGAVTNAGTSRSTSMTIRNSLFARNQAIAAAGGDGLTTLSAAFGGAMGISGAGVVVTVSRSSFTGNQAIAGAPSSNSTGNLLAGIAVGGAIENDTGAILMSRGVVQAEPTAPAARLLAVASAISWRLRP